MRIDRERLTDRASYPLWSRDLVRYGDVDMQGHVNNVSFARFSETARVEFLYRDLKPVFPEDCYFVIVKLVVDFRQEVLWPATVDIGSAVLAIGRSSLTLVQGMFVDDRCVATAENVIVLNSAETRRSTPLPDALRQCLGSYMLAPGGE